MMHVESHTESHTFGGRLLAVAAADPEILSEIRHPKKAGKTRSGDGQQADRKALYGQDRQ